MILYRLAKSMEERTLLQKRIHETTGDTSELLQEKEQVEAQMLRQANQWLEGGSTQTECTSQEAAGEYAQRSAEPDLHYETERSYEMV